MKESENLQLSSIGIIHTPFKGCEGAPIQPATANGAEGTVEIFEEFAPALKDLAGFDRIWLVYWFHLTRGLQLRVTPFLDNTKRGLFATRAPCRPNPIGVSNVRLLTVEGTRLRIADVDMLDGTPLLDIKPYVPRFDCFPVVRCGWLDAATVKCGAADGRFASHKPRSKEKNNENPNFGHGLPEVQETRRKRGDRRSRAWHPIRNRKSDGNRKDHCVRRDDDAGAGGGRQS
jgi:tRNA (adenine37-N6)-methyltransferase